MKKIIIIISILSSFTFAKTGMMTGMLTPADESSMGAWLNYEVATLDDSDGWKSSYTLSFEYMTTMGLEVGLSMGNGFLGSDDADWKGLDLGYHLRMDKYNLNFSYARKMFDDVDTDFDQLWINSYCSNGLFGGFGGYKLETPFGKSDWEFELLKIGYLHSLESGMTIGVNYYANTDDIMEGTISLLAGYNF